MIGEMWFGVCIAVVIDLVPADLTTSAVAVYFFIIQIIGGNMPLFVTPITEGLNLRAAMVICFPGFYLVGAAFFGLAFVLLMRKEKRNAGKAEDEEDTKGKKDIDSVDMKSTDQLTINQVSTDTKM